MIIIPGGATIIISSDKMAASSTPSSTRSLSSTTSMTTAQESVSTTALSGYSSAINQSTILESYKPPSNNQVSIGLNIIQNTISTINSNNGNNNNISPTLSLVSLSSPITSPESHLLSSSQLSSSRPSTITTASGINILHNDVIVPTILSHHSQTQQLIPNNDDIEHIQATLVTASTTSCITDVGNNDNDIILSESSHNQHHHHNHHNQHHQHHHHHHHHEQQQHDLSSNIIDNSMITTSTQHHHNFHHQHDGDDDNDSLKVIAMGGSSSPSSLSHLDDVNAANIIDDCCPSTTLSHHDAILMQMSVNDNNATTSTTTNIIPTSPIATLSLNSNNSNNIRQTIGMINNNNTKNVSNNNNNNNNIEFGSQTITLIGNDLDDDEIENICNERHQITGITSCTISNANMNNNNNNNNSSIIVVSNIGSSTSNNENKIKSDRLIGGGSGVVVTAPSSSSSTATSSSTSTISYHDNNKNDDGNRSFLSNINANNNVTIKNNSSSVTDDFNLSTDSLSDESSLHIVEDGVDDEGNLDENEGYQDNTSSNSQQSGGGGSTSGVGLNNNSSGNGTTGSVITGNGNSSYISLLPPPVGTTGAIGQSIEPLDIKYLFEELCPVCGDKVSGYHYGLLTCESCKGFFKRTVQNKKVYTCVAERSCHIDKTQRKRCPYCRFQKCLEVGMKLEAVRADRMRGGRNKFGPMYKRDRARKLQMMRQRQLALQAIRGSMGGNALDIKPGQISPTGYQQSYPSMNIKQEIQIPQVSSLTQSPDSSPSPIAIALGQVNPSTAINANSLGGSVGVPGSTNTTIGSGASGNGNHGHGSDTGSSTSLQHTTDSKLCFDTGTNPTSTADSVNTEPLRVSPMIREFVQSIDDREWQTQLFTLLQKQSYNQVEVDLFELMCKVLDQNLFSQVDWARNTVFFKDLKVDDQMKLLQHSWSDMLVLDHLHQRIHNNLPDETPLNNGQVFNLLGLGLLGVPQLADFFNDLQNKLQELKFDMGDYVCMKFLILLNPDVRGIINKKTVLEGHENVQAALLDYTLTCYPTVTDKFSRLLSILPDIHAMAGRGEEHLYLKHVAGSAPTQTLLMEMLHAKRKV